MHLNWIELAGFRRHISPLRINLNKSGFILLLGKNGSGKTSVAEAIAWCLYGKPIKEGNKEDVATYAHLRDSSYVGTYARLGFTAYEQQYEILRTLKTLQLFENGQEIVLANKDSQATINELVGMSRAYFLNTVFTRQKSDSLFEQSNANLDDALYELFSDLAVYELYITNANNKLIEEQKLFNENKVKVESYKAQLANALALASMLEEQQEKFELEKQNSLYSFNSQLSEKKDRINILKVELAVTSKSLEDFNIKFDESYLIQLKEELALLNESQLESKSSNTSLKMSWAYINDSLKALKQPLAVCDKCNRPFDEESVNYAMKVYTEEYAHIADELASLELDLANCNTNLSEIEKEQKRLQSLVREEELKKLATEKSYKAQEQAKFAIEANINLLNAGIENIKANIQALEVKAYDNKALLKSQEQIKDLELKIKAISLDDTKIQIAQYWAKKGFQKLRTRALNNKLNLLNSFFAEASILTGVQPRIEKLARGYSLTVLKDGYEVKYQDLSGGEQKRADLSLTYALYKTQISKAYINIAIVDEPFDGLDDEGIALVVQLISQLADTVLLMNHIRSVNLYCAETIEF